MATVTAQFSEKCLMREKELGISQFSEKGFIREKHLGWASFLEGVSYAKKHTGLAKIKRSQSSIASVLKMK